MKRKATTYEKFIRDSKQKELLDHEYSDLLISELFFALEQEEDKKLHQKNHFVGADKMVQIGSQTDRRTGICPDPQPTSHT